jgi:hypothetical protein
MRKIVLGRRKEDERRRKEDVLRREKDECMDGRQKRNEWMEEVSG